LNFLRYVNASKLLKLSIKNRTIEGFKNRKLRKMDPTAPQMDIQDDDEPQVIFESSSSNPNTNTSSRRRRARRNKANKPQEPLATPTATYPVLIDDNSVEEVEIENTTSMSGLKSEHTRQESASSANETVFLSDSDEDMKVELDSEDNQTIPDVSMITDDTLPTENGVDETPQPSEESMTFDSTDAEIEDVTPPEILRATRLRQAEELKGLGNDYFGAKDYHKALEMYTKAIDALPEAPFYGNRSACFMMLKKYKLAQSDARTAVQIDPTFTNGYLRLLRATLALGDTVGAESIVTSIKASNLGVNIDVEERRLVTLKALRHEMQILKDRKDYRTLLFHCERGLAIAEGDVELKMLKADVLLKLNRMGEAQELCTEVLQLDSYCVEAYYIRSICLYAADNLDKGIQFLKQALQFAPDSTLILSLFRKMKKLKEVREEAGDFFSKGKYAEAKTKFQECITAVKEFEYPNGTIESKMSLNLSLIALKLGEVDEGLTLVNRAVELNPSYLKALLHRAQLHKTKEMFNEAVSDYEAAQKLDPRNTQYRKYIQDMKLAAKKALRKDYYKVLGVDKNASQDEVKKAYKKRALIHHPDRHSSASESVQKEQEKQFKELGQAYEILSDPKKRNRYDAGHDLLDSPDGGFGHGEFDTSNLFNVFFGAGGMGGGCPRSSGFQQQHHRTYSNFHPY